MARIKIQLDHGIVNGESLTFKSPVDCSQVTGLVVHYYKSGVKTSKAFEFADAQGANVGSKHLFTSNVLVKVILDLELSKAYVQNAVTNSYIESRLTELESGAAGSNHQMFFGSDQPQEKGPWIWLQTIRSRALDVEDAVLELSLEEPEDGDVVTEIEGTEYTVENASTDPNAVGEGQYLFDINN